MIAAIQRVSQAAVTIKNSKISEINAGLVILLGVMSDDEADDCQYLKEKIVNLRIFNDENGKMNLSLKDFGGEVLVVSQFTLCGDYLKGRRPSFINAASPEKGEELYNLFIKYIKSEMISTKTGEFGAMMDVSLVNDGPVTFVLDSKLYKN